MNRLVKKITLAGLIVIVIIELIVLNLAVIPRILELRRKSIPAAKKRYEKVNAQIEEIRVARERKGTGVALTNEGAPTLAVFKRLAMQAGVGRTPQFRQWPGRTRIKKMEKTLTEVKVFNEQAGHLFRLLESIEGLSGAGRIETVSIFRRKVNEFDLTVLYATFKPSAKK